MSILSTNTQASLTVIIVRIIHPRDRFEESFRITIVLKVTGFNTPDLTTCKLTIVTVRKSSRMDSKES